jgi:hypothetical protein
LAAEIIDFSARPGIPYYYRLEVVMKGGSSKFLGMVSGQVLTPTRFEVAQNRPNPFNPVTVIPYAVPSASLVSVRIYDVTGRLVRTLVDAAPHAAGYHEIVWDGRDNQRRDMGSGVYISRFTRTPLEGGAAETRLQKMVLVR